MKRYCNVEPILHLLSDKDLLESVNVGAVLQALQHGLYNGEVAPVVHAHWETDKHAALDFCSSCGEAVERYVTAEQMDKSNYKGATYWNYCPHCGAKMDEEGAVVATEMTDEMFERVTNLAFENGHRAGYEQAIVDSQKAISFFSAQALEKLNDYRLTNINCGAKMDEKEGNI